jgi:hypothetical protein
VVSKIISAAPPGLIRTAFYTRFKTLVFTHIFFDLERVFLMRVSFRSISPRNKAFGVSANGAIYLQPRPSAWV